jgi:hypothetical protein
VQNDQRRYETIFNVIDGVIAVTGVETGRDPQVSPQDGYSNEKDLSAVLGAVFFRLHRCFNAQSGPAQANADIAKTMVADSLKSGSPLPLLPHGVIGAWIPKAASNNKAITNLELQFDMRKWLNYVIVHVSSEHETFSVLNECLRQHQINNVATLTWEAHQLYEIGQW